jgi:hypothetical protein
MQNAQVQNPRRRSPMLCFPHPIGPPAAVTLTVAIALLVAGCGSGSPSSSSSSGSTQSFHTLAAQAYKFSACMRAHGVTGFPDPVVSSTSGRQTIRIQAVTGVSPQDKTARQACQDLLPTPSKSDLAAQAQAQRARASGRLAFARCMRTHGFNRFPDPDSQGQLTLQMLTQAGIDLHTPALLTAGRACAGVSHGAISPADVERAVNGGGQ